MKGLHRTFWDLFRSSASVLHPENVHIIGAEFGPIIDEVQIALLQGRTRARVEPLLDFRMAVGKRKAARPVVITGWIVHDLPLRRPVGIPSHVDHEIAIVDVILNGTSEPNA